MLHTGNGSISGASPTCFGNKEKGICIKNAALPKNSAAFLMRPPSPLVRKKFIRIDLETLDIFLISPYTKCR